MTVQLLVGDSLAHLRTLPAESVHCCVSSPPYWGLRDYGVPGAIGLEETLQEHITALIAVFAEVRRVLRKDGTLWLNYGDAYAGSWGAQSRDHAGKDAPNVSKLSANQVRAMQTRRRTGSSSRHGLKPKDRMLLPARVALALQADGWWLRDEIVWHKPNPMPMSIKDRTTPAHEFIYMLSKSARYYYDQEAVKEPIAEASKARYAQATVDQQQGGFKQDAYESGITGARARSRRPNEILKELARQHNNYDEKLVAGEKWGARHKGWDAVKDSVTTRNRRSVWTIPPKPFKGAHFATFPPALVAPCILAGCPEGGTVLDPFAGSGTVGLVCCELRRNAVLIELNPAYATIIRRRLGLEDEALADLL